ncbi:XTP/dITP diphosphatase [Thermococcus piezophilus]|uniref:dITP/XTP pyrophosphatase n=1 Tax=Thermococcus piezophilus TaxID=1712654 RepID=A0A172WGF7_9EURY|nr:XTP/dITP diphosphatase [Thermococcus piezophilus]ANF22439.1 non-canonical purine NTP pyrophosphatase, RdgB/HAM1 family [Thermococcus piezophilus]
MRLAFITSNPGKVEEARKYFEPLGVEVYQLRVEYPEIQAETLEEVALFGLEWLSRKLKEPFFLDDSGLFVEALGGFPGVYSAYVYKTLGNEGLLKLLEGVENRKAYFKSVVAYWDGEAHLFTGVVHGEIIHEKRGDMGFGFDPIFRPSGFEKTFAEMTTIEKNRISHRGQALKAFSEWLKENLK